MGEEYVEKLSFMLTTCFVRCVRLRGIHPWQWHNKWLATASCFRSEHSWVRSRCGLRESRTAQLRVNPVRSGCEDHRGTLHFLSESTRQWLEQHSRTCLDWSWFNLKTKNLLVIIGLQLMCYIEASMSKPKPISLRACFTSSPSSTHLIVALYASHCLHDQIHLTLTTALPPLACSPLCLFKLIFLLH